MGGHAELIQTGSGEFWAYVAVCVFLVLFAGFASGLTTGLMSLDPIHLKVLESEGTEGQKKSAHSILELLRRRHLVLVTLLVSNSIAMEALPVFLDRLTPAWLAVLLSVTAVLIFGEVVPQALCTGRNQFAIASVSAPLVRVLVILLWLVSFPIAKLLDVLLGDESEQHYARPHLKALIRMHRRETSCKSVAGGDSAADTEQRLGSDEVVVIEGALDMANKTLGQIMVPVEKTFMLEWQTKLTQSLKAHIVAMGHSRIPLYDESRDNIKGILHAKSLITATTGGAGNQVGPM
eukprot:GHVU01035701.1.p1 GENE.GHVU01035701.1~~GHVU01035701.1.p1  ORF type:complete len:292 (+),score=57.03 GHVU01035701.1:531-1406(+)